MREITRRRAGLSELPAPIAAFGLNKWSGLIVRFASKRKRARWNDHARKFAGNPDVNSIAKIERLVQTATLDVERVGMPAAPMPQTRAADRTERAFERVPRCGFARPVAWRALQQPVSTPCHRKRDSERGRRLLPTFGAMARVDDQRRFRHRITYAAALAAARLLIRI
jgi:hypothetical protein